MALTQSRMLALGSAAPDFSLPEPLTGQVRSLQQMRGDNATLIVFMCNHCPFVKHVIDGLIRLANDYRDSGVVVVAINANDVKTHPEDSPEKMASWAEEKSFGFPYLYDESQEVAQAYQAACTPDFFVFDSALKCRYRGQMDNARPTNTKPNDGADLRAALDALLASRPVSDRQYPSSGCNIKWKQ